MPRSPVFACLLVLCACGVPVETTSGTEVGHPADGMVEYLGIRYAEPPTGALRFMPPVPRATQTGEHQAMAYGASCENQEDCLFLNVFAPPDAKALPVMVWIHGGALVAGSGGSARTLAKKGHVVTVTLNYRLGAFGFLVHEELAKEPGNVSGNYGLLDQQLALTWVRDNIEAFGGDPGNVTIFGESAGALSVCYQLASPPARGLFHRAIAESGSCVLPQTSLERAQSTGVTVAQTLGCQGDVGKCLRGASFDALKKVLPADSELNGNADHWAAVGDDVVLPRDVFGAFERGDFAKVPFLSGANGNEGSLFTLLMKVDTRADFERIVRGAAANHADELIPMYPEADYPAPRDAATALISDAFVCGQRRQAALVAKHVPQTYLYHFTRVNPALQGNLGSTHGSEIPYVFGEIGWPLVELPADRALSDEMIGYWTRFARSGDPNGAEAVKWPVMAEQGEYLKLDATIAPDTRLQAEHCDRFDGWMPNL